MNEKLNFESSLLDALPNSIYYQDIEGNIIKHNSRFENLVSTKREKIIGKYAYDFFPQSVAMRHRSIDKKMMLTLESCEDEVHLTRPSGEIRYYILKKSICLGENGTPVGMVCIMNDITQRMKEKNLLIQHSKFVKLGEMMGAIAHQWNEPLVELSALIQKIELCYNTNKIGKDKVSLFVHESMAQIQYMSETLNDFKNFLKPSTKKHKFGIKKAIQEIFDIIGKQIFYLNITINFDYEDEKEVYLFGYKNEIKQVLLNIINNAKEKIVNLNKRVDFEGQITLRVKEDQNSSIIEIMDNAGVIEEEAMDMLFDPFFTTKENGTGFGLYMAKVIIEDKMSGRIMVENSENSVTFKIKIPKQDS